MKTIFLALAAAFVLMIGVGAPAQPAAAASAKLVMFSSPACVACRNFKRQMAGKYRRSPEGRAAPLRIVNVRSSRARKLYRAGVRPAAFTPTFVLMRNGREVSRFYGYSSPGSFMNKVKNARRYWVGGAGGN